MSRQRVGTLFAGLILLAGPAWAQRFRPDDPLRRDADDLPIAMPRPIEVSSNYDGIHYSLVEKPGRPARAANVNTLDEVPDSSWFMNRIGARAMTIEELMRGPNTIDGPDTTHPWRVVSGKAEGVTPGFTVRDARGDLFFVKVDPKGWPHLGTAVDVIGAKFFHAFGYWVPENYIARVRPEDLRLDAEAHFTGAGGKRRRMTQADLERILALCPREPDGTVRVVASRALPGKPLGPFRYERTRADDPNDVFRHEDHRELRALRVFCEWLNHVDSSSHNTLDIYVGSPGQGHVRHNLIDFNGILGSSSDTPREAWEGNEYVLPWSAMLKSALTFGIWDRPWRHVAYTSYVETGPVEAEFFRPERWKPYYPNPAHDRMRPDDALWAAGIVMRFSDEAVRAIVHTGEYSNPAAEAHLADTIIRRRDKVLAYHLSQINPLSDFRLEGDLPKLLFRNLGREAGLATETTYEYAWFSFDNDTERLTALGSPGTTREPVLDLPAQTSEFLMVRLRTRAPGEPRWGTAVDVYLRRGREVVGIDREI